MVQEGQAKVGGHLVLQLTLGKSHLWYVKCHPVVVVSQRRKVKVDIRLSFGVSLIFLDSQFCETFSLLIGNNTSCWPPCRQVWLRYLHKAR